MKQATDIGTNRTGIASAPLQGPQAIESAREGTPDAAGNGLGIARTRQVYVSDSGPVGTVPSPLTIKGMAKSAIAALSGETVTVLLDKLGQRLAFERTGTRLYEAAASKARALGSTAPSAEELLDIATEEREHMELVRAALEELGADPTAQTPSADVAGVACTGLLQVVTDPRANMPETLEVLLAAELIDRESWTLLIQLVRELGYDELAGRFVGAEREEALHQERVRTWLATLLRQAAAV